MKLAFLRLKYSEEDNKKADFELRSYLKGGFTYHGEPHAKDYVTKDDQDKRRELKNMGYRVYSIHYSTPEEDMQKLAVLFD